MLRHLHLTVLIVASAVFTNAVDVPAGFLRPRQIGNLASGISSVLATTTAAPTTTQQSTTANTVPTTTASPSAASPTTTQASNTPTTQQATTSVTSQQPQSTSAVVLTSQQATSPTLTRTTNLAATTQPGSTVATTINNPTTTVDSTIPNSESTSVSTSLAPVPQSLTTITFTSDGRLVSSTATGTAIAAPTSTSKPGLASNYGDENNTLSDGAKKIVGGIVGGVGGTLLLAGIAFVFYKMWGRKKHQRVAGEEEMFGSPSAGSTDSIAAQKARGWGPSSLTSRFAEPLARYKSPNGGTAPSAWGGKSAGSVNAASNF